MVFRRECVLLVSRQAHERSLEHVRLNMIVFKVTFSSCVLFFCKNVRTLKSLSNTKLVECFFSASLRQRPPPPPPLPPRPGARRLLFAPSGFHLLSSPRSLFCVQRELWRLDDGVPVKVVLDVIGLHAMHLEVSGGDHVLLVHLCMVSRHCGSCGAHWRHVGVSRRSHQGHALSGVHVEISCVMVLAGFVGVHGAMTNRRLHCPLWLDYTGAGKKLVD